MQLFVDFYVFTCFWLNLSDRNLKLFWTSKQNNFRFRSSKFSQKRVKIQKATSNRMSIFGLLGKNMGLSHIVLAVFKIFPIYVVFLDEFDFHLNYFQSYFNLKMYSFIRLYVVYRLNSIFWTQGWKFKYFC